MNICYIFGAAKGMNERVQISKSDLVIAADAGVNHLEKINIKPNKIIGDFDSLGCEPRGGNVIKFPKKKDDTDTMLAVKEGLKKGYKDFVIYGGTGGRFDHTYANIQTLSYISSNGGTGLLCGEDFTACAITNGSISFNASAKGNVSVFAACTKAKGVTIDGLLYSVTDTELDFDFPLGVSNEFIGVDSKITIKEGTVIIIWQGTEDDIKTVERSNDEVP